MSFFSRNARALLSFKNALVLPKRWSGHNILEPHPSNFHWMKWKDMLHLYAMVGLIPVTVISTIVNIRANPELAEIPEGYEPRHWEYFRHPITRFIARYVLTTQDEEHELKLGILDRESEKIIIKQVSKRIAKVMSFYNDYRAYYFQPWWSDDLHEGREKHRYATEVVTGIPSTFFSKGIDMYVPSEGLADETERTRNE